MKDYRPRFNWGSSVGQKNRMAKLSNEQVDDMRTRRANGASVRELREQFGISDAQVRRIVNYVSRLHFNVMDD